MSTIPEYGDLGQGLATFFFSLAELYWPTWVSKCPHCYLLPLVWTFPYQPRYLLVPEHHLCFHFQTFHLQFLFAVVWISPSPILTPCVAPTWERYLLSITLQMLTSHCWLDPCYGKAFFPYINNPSNDLWGITRNNPYLYQNNSWYFFKLSVGWIDAMS